MIPLTRRLGRIVVVLGVFMSACAGSAAMARTAHKSSSPTATATGPFSWENAVIRIEVASKVYSYVQPWAAGKRAVEKTGVVIDGHLIITTAEGLENQTLIRLQKGGGGLFSAGRIVWIDYQANLAALTTEEPLFWQGLQAAQLADPAPVDGGARVLRWQSDHLDNRPADIERMLVNNSALSFVSVPEIKVNSAVTGLGAGEILASGDRLIGLICQQEGDVITAVPSSFLDSILKARAAKSYTGLGYFDFTWDPVLNPLCLEALKVTGPTRGVIVRETGLKPGIDSPINSRDVIVNIDGFDIDAQGNYRDPQYHKLSLENLSSRGKWAGTSCKLTVWRDGKEQQIDYHLPKAEYSDELVPNHLFDQVPQYVLAGGFVFVPLSNDYLRSWGAEWRQHAPFRLFYYNLQKITPDRPGRVVLSQVLPNPVNLGYESLRNAVVDQINGMKIKTIADVATALKSPQNGFDVFEFAQGENIAKAVLDASALNDANARIMSLFHIPQDHVLNSEVVQQGSMPMTTAAR